jgi:excisionase family DNA binding protein
MKPDAGIRLLKVADVAAALQLSKRQVHRLITQGQLSVVHIGRAVRIDPGELARLASSGIPPGLEDEGREEKE